MTLTLDASGELIVSAVCEATPIAPPVCVVSVYSNAPTQQTDTDTDTDTSVKATVDTHTEPDEKGGCKSAIGLSAVCVLASVGISAAVFSTRSKDEE